MGFNGVIILIMGLIILLWLPLWFNKPTVVITYNSGFIPWVM